MNRLPLALGVSAINDLAIGAVAILLGFSATLALVSAPLMTDSITALFVVIAGGFSPLGWAAMRSAWRARPSDAIFGVDGMRIDGGALSGTSLGWTNIEPMGCAVSETRERLGPVSRVVWRLSLAGRNGARLTVAEVHTREEAASLEEVLAAIRARTDADDENGATEVLRCPSCGAPLVPTVSGGVRCPYCGTVVVIPAHIHDRIRAAAQLGTIEGRVEHAVASLVTQPTATETTRVVVGGAMVGMLGVPVTFSIGLRAALHHRLGFGLGMLLCILPFVFVAAGYFVARGRLVDRRALCAMALRFGARRAEREGGPPSCHACLGPLDASGAVLVRCLHCGATNVTAVDLGLRTVQLRGSTASLEQAIEARQRERQKWRRRTLASVPFFVLAAIALRVLIAYA